MNESPGEMFAALDAADSRVREVWVIEHGQYEAREILGVAASLEDAAAFARKHVPHMSDSTVEWDAPHQHEHAERVMFIMVAHFTATAGPVVGYKWDDEYDFTQYELTGVDQ